MKNGASDYTTKGDDNDRIILLSANAMEKVQFQKRVQQLENLVAKKYSFESIIGTSKQIKASTELATKVTLTDATVLQSGETGTIK